MSDFIIRVENLGKKYKIRHQQQERYVALRDVMARRVIGVGYSVLSGIRSWVPGLRCSASNGHQPISNGNGNHASRDTEYRTPNPQNLTPKTEEFWALKDVSFEVKQGEVVGIIGRNGAGKSTLLKILSRITEPTEGRVRIRGRVASLLEVGTGFHPELTGRENIFVNGAILGMTREEVRRKFDEIIAFAEIEKFLDTPVKRYSSGMYVRLAFAVAAHLEPEILLVDEVLAVGDTEFQKKCLGKMGDVAKGGRTVLFVSHNMAAIQSLCCKGIFLEKGYLLKSGSVDSVIHDYLERPLQPRSGDVGLISLGRKLLLRCLSFVPGTVMSGESVDFRLELLSREPVRLRQAAILIFSELGARVAVLDFRQIGLRDIEVSEMGSVVEGRIHALPLVEGDYRIGLYLATCEHQDNYLDLATFTVLSRVGAGDLIPYPAVHRGHVELGFTARLGSRAPIEPEHLCVGEAS